MASEVGVLDVDPAKVVKKGRLEPGRMFLVDTTQGRIVDDEEIKHDLATEQPYEQWLDDGLVHLDDLPPRDVLTPVHSSQVQQQRLFGWTQEEQRILIAPMARTGAEAIGSMGTDTPIAVAVGPAAPALRLLPAAVRAGHEPAARRHPRGARHEPRLDDRARGATCSTPARESCRQIVLPHPVLDNEDLAKLRYIDEDGGVAGYKPVTIDALYPVLGGGDGLRLAIERIRRQVSDAIAGGVEPRHPLGPLRDRGARRRSRACSSPRRCTTTSSARRPARGSGSSSRPARRARCTTSRCSSGTARPR